MATYNFEKKSAEEQSRAPHNDGFVKADGWINVLTGLGIRGRDKNVNAHFRLEKIFEQAELDQLYRSDGGQYRIRIIKHVKDFYLLSLILSFFPISNLS